MVVRTCVEAAGRVAAGAVLGFVFELYVFPSFSTMVFMGTHPGDSKDIK